MNHYGRRCDTSATVFNAFGQFQNAIPFSYLHKGTKFKAVSPTKLDETPRIRYGVADMDGHLVSENYGERVGNTYYTKKYPEKNYINVKYDGEKYGIYTPNESIQVHEDLTIYVDDDAFAQYLADLEENEQRAAAAQKSSQRVAAEAALRDATKAQNAAIAAQNKAMQQVEEARKLLNALDN